VLTAAIGGITLLTVLASYLLGEPLLVLVFGEKIRPFVSYLIPIVLASALTAYFSFLCMLATVQRIFRWLLVSCAIGLGAELVLTAEWIDFVGVNATSYSLILAMALASLILLVGILLNVFSKPKTEKLPMLNPARYWQK
jgi:O-antigen/teichoic acid export membrane protein